MSLAIDRLDSRMPPGICPFSVAFWPSRTSLRFPASSQGAASVGLRRTPKTESSVFRFTPCISSAIRCNRVQCLAMVRPNPTIQLSTRKHEKRACIRLCSIQLSIRWLRVRVPSASLRRKVNPIKHLRCCESSLLLCRFRRCPPPVRHVAILADLSPLSLELWP